QVYFGGVLADPGQTDVLNENRIQIITPVAPAGIVDVTVAEPTAQLPCAATAQDCGVLATGFEFYDRVTVTVITPTRGSTLGGTGVFVTGSGFIADSSVQFGTTPPVRASVDSPTRLFVHAPPLAYDVYAVTVANSNGRDTLAG